MIANDSAAVHGVSPILLARDALSLGQMIKAQKRSKNQTLQQKSPRTPKRIHRSIKMDVVNPADYMKYDFRFSCDECTHFDHQGEQCTIGYDSTVHRKTEQERTYRLSGRMALCRLMEID